MKSKQIEYATIELDGIEKSWVVELPIQQAIDMEQDGFEIQWIEKSWVDNGKRH